MDGEAEHVPSLEVDAHLAGCATCARWLEQSEALTRRLRVGPVVEAPDLSGAILARVPVKAEPRYGLVVVAVLQMGVALSQVLGSVAHGAGHLFNEGVAWNLALAVGFLVAAMRPEHVPGLRVVLAGFVSVLGAYSVYDLVTAEASLVRVLSHLPVLLGLVLLYVGNGPGDRAVADGGGIAGISPPSEGRDAA
ncbi:hypothetical protein GCM10023148_08150 [Actinokineospora soli]